MRRRIRYHARPTASRRHGALSPPLALLAPPGLAAILGKLASLAPASWQLRVAVALGARFSEVGNVRDGRVMRGVQEAGRRG